MSAAEPKTQPIACVPGAITQAERAAHFALARRLFTETANARMALPDGYEFRFAPDAITAIAQFVVNERKCCPFMRFDISIAPDGGPVSLCMTGPEGTRAVLDAELGLSVCSANGCGCHEA
jgi:hypothetical protein